MIERRLCWIRNEEVKKCDLLSCLRWHGNSKIQVCCLYVFHTIYIPYVNIFTVETKLTHACSGIEQLAVAEAGTWRKLVMLWCLANILYESHWYLHLNSRTHRQTRWMLYACMRDPNVSTHNNDYFTIIASAHACSALSLSQHMLVPLRHFFPSE